MGIADLHNHTVFSDGKLTASEVYRAACSKGYRAGIADHCGDGDFQINDDQQFCRYLDSLEGLNVFRSAELDLGTEIRVSDKLLNSCDYLIGGVHSIGGLDFFDQAAVLPHPENIIENMLQLIDARAGKYGFDILAHPGLLPVALRKSKDKLLDKKWSQRLIELALKHGFALEISSRWELPSYDTIRMAVEAGATFSLGSDGHCSDTVCNLDISLAMIEKALVPEDLIFSGNRVSRRKEYLRSGH